VGNMVVATMTKQVFLRLLHVVGVVVVGRSVVFLVVNIQRGALVVHAFLRKNGIGVGLGIVGIVGIVSLVI